MPVVSVMATGSIPGRFGAELRILCERRPKANHRTVRDAYDNAMAGSVFASLECELIEQRSLETKTEARLAAFT